MIISLANQKGGVGKSTLATNLAFGFSKKSRTLLIDADIQGSSLDWLNARATETELCVMGLPRSNIHKEVKKIGTSYNTIIIDTPPHSPEVVRSAIMASQLVLIPVQPSPYDIWSAAETVKLVKEMSQVNDVLKGAFVINRKIVNSSIGNAVSDALLEYELPVYKSHICQRVAFSESASLGKSVLEQNGISGRECTKLLNEIIDNE